MDCFVWCSFSADYVEHHSIFDFQVRGTGWCPCWLQGKLRGTSHNAIMLVPLWKHDHFHCMNNQKASCSQHMQCTSPIPDTGHSLLPRMALLASSSQTLPLPKHTCCLSCTHTENASSTTTNLGTRQKHESLSGALAVSQPTPVHHPQP